MFQTGQTHFKNLAANAAKGLWNCVFPEGKNCLKCAVWNIKMLQERHLTSSVTGLNIGLLH